MRNFSAWLSIVLFSILPALAASFGDVRGLVHDPSHRPVAGAEVVLRARSSDYTQNTRTDQEGEFHFSVVPVGEYVLRIQREGFAAAEQVVVVTSGSAPILHFPLSIATQQQSVQVSETSEALNPQQMTPETLVSRQQIERAPGADRTNSLAMITDFVPGSYMIHDQLHVRGGHQVSWLVDGVPVPNTNIASNVGPQFDPQDIDYLEAQRGSYSAAYGDRTYGVFNIVPRTGFERNNEAELSVSYGQFHQTNDVFSYGGHSDRFAYYFSANGNRTDLGLATPTSAILHDQASGGGGFASFIYNLRPTDQLRLVTSLRADHYQIPNSLEDQEAGVRDVENEQDALVNFSWVHTIRDGTLLTVSPFYHFNRADYLGGPDNPDLSATDKHASQYGGAQISLRATTKRHNATAGLYAFGQHDVTDFGLTAAGSGGPMLAQADRSSGHLEAVFLEDQFKPVPWLTLTGGVRLTHFSGVISENAASPRVGAALRIPKLGWILRGFYGRYYQAPPLATVSGPLAFYAVDQGFEFLPLYGERDEENQFGLTIPWRGWSVDVDHFNTRAHNYFDHDALGNSNIFLPLTIERAHISAFEVTLQSPLLLRRGRMHLAYSNQRAEAWGPVTGGLTDFEPPPEGPFLLDHDQRNTLSVGGFVNLPRQAWASANLNYGSGFPDAGGPSRLEAHTTVDLALGKSFGENWAVAVNAVNVANRHFLLDNSPTFGGTHYFNPREIYVQVKYRFRF